MKRLKFSLLIFALLISGCIVTVPDTTDIDSDVEIPDTTQILSTETIEIPINDSQETDLSPIPIQTEKMSDSTVQEPEPTSISVPTEEQSTAMIPNSIKARHVGIDRHHGGIYRDIAEYFFGKGWIVEDIDVEPITQSYLEEKEISILYIANVTLAYTEDEILEIKNFVNAGGGLIIESSYPYPYYKNLYQSEIARSFGVRFSEQGDGTPEKLTITIQNDHFLFEDVSSLYLDEAVPFLTCEPPSFAILAAGNTEPYKPVIAIVEYGKGRVVVFPDIKNKITNADNQYFLRNVLYWLQQENLP